MAGQPRAAGRPAARSLSEHREHPHIPSMAPHVKETPPAWPGGERMLDDDFDMVPTASELEALQRSLSLSDSMADSVSDTSAVLDAELETMAALMNDHLDMHGAKHDEMQDSYLDAVARLQAERLHTARLRNELEVARALSGMPDRSERPGRAATFLASKWRARLSARSALPKTSARASIAIQRAVRAYLAAIGPASK